MKGITRCLSNWSPVLCSFLFFIGTYYGGDREAITVASIFSFMQIFILVKESIVNLSVGLETIEYAKIIFDRFCPIFNCENISMRNLSLLSETPQSKDKLENVRKKVSDQKNFINEVDEAKEN